MLIFVWRSCLLDISPNCKHSPSVVILWYRGLVFSGYYSCTTNSISQISLRLEYCYQALCEKCLYSELFCSVFSHNQTEYGDLLFKTPYSVQIGETKDAVSVSEGRNKKTSGIVRLEIHSDFIFHQTINRIVMLTLNSYEYAVITFFLLNIFWLPFNPFMAKANQWTGFHMITASVMKGLRALTIFAFFKARSVTSFWCLYC